MLPSGKEPLFPHLEQTCYRKAKNSIRTHVELTFVEKCLMQKDIKVSSAHDDNNYNFNHLRTVAYSAVLVYKAPSMTVSR